jgi:serine/threonine-protein kinase RsbW
MYQLSVPSNPQYIHRVEKFLLGLNEELHIEEEKLHKLMVVVTEAVNNGITHGNHRDESKFVTVNCSVENGILTVRVRDEGSGFNPQTLPDPLHPDNLMRDSGRGVFLMRQMMDTVSYNEKGTEVTMTMRIGK